MAGRVITLYCAGTAYDSQSKDIIAWCNANTSGTRGSDFLFFPGPGSGEWGKSATSGLTSAAAGLLKKGAELARSAGPLSGAANFAVGAMARQALGSIGAAQTGLNALEQAAGASMGDTVDAAVAALRQLVGTGTVTLNMAGWSRGAITCLKLAHALSADKVLSLCPVNLFLFDPVPGPKRLNAFNWTDDLKSLGVNIKRLGVVLMEDESRFGDSMGALMEPLTQPFTSCTAAACGGVPKDRIQLYPMPGTHGSAVEGAEPGDVFAEAADIGAHLCCAFLREVGTPVAAGKLLKPADIIERYSRLKRRLLLGTRENSEYRSSVIPNAERAGRFFINAHHRATFAAQFPSIARLLDPGFNVVSWGPAVLAEAKLLRSTAPTAAQVVAQGIHALLVSMGRRPGTMRDRSDLEQLHFTLSTGR